MSIISEKQTDLIEHLNPKLRDIYYLLKDYNELKVTEAFEILTKEGKVKVSDKTFSKRVQQLESLKLVQSENRREGKTQRKYIRLTSNEISKNNEVSKEGVEISKIETFTPSLAETEKFKLVSSQELEDLRSQNDELRSQQNVTRLTSEIQKLKTERDQLKKDVELYYNRWEEEKRNHADTYNKVEEGFQIIEKLEKGKINFPDSDEVDDFIKLNKNNPTYRYLWEGLFEHYNTRKNGKLAGPAKANRRCHNLAEKYLTAAKAYARQKREEVS